MAGAFFANVAANLVAKLGEYLFAPIGRQFGYVLLHESYVEDLENGVKELETARERVQGSVNEAVYDGKSIHTDVKNWLDSVNEEAEEAENLLKRGKSAKYACFGGWLPNPMVRHAIGEKVKKMTQVIRGLYEKSQNSNFQKVYHENTPLGIVAATASAAKSVDNNGDELESRAKITEDVMKAIVDDKLCVIGVWGAGGVGKSKLLEGIERQVKEKKLFDVVVMANVSRNIDLKRIQGEIAYALGLRLTNDEPARGRADRLCKRLQCDPKKNVLIILDNLWEKLELKEVGIPCEYDNKVRGCKLLLTSRYRDVLRRDMVCDQEFCLNKLEHGEARKLFERVVGDRVNDPEFKPLIDGVVQKCGGLPLLILSVAKRLKHGVLPEWRNALTNIEESNLKSIMELNYNDLKDERIKSLFLICALSSGRIRKWDYLVYCVGLGLFKKSVSTIIKTIDRLTEDTRSLQDSSLLLDSDDSDNKIRMHDIYVDMAISIASTEWNALVGRNDYGFKEWSKDELRNCIVMSFHFVGIHELPEKLDCPNLRMFLLVEDNPSLVIPESFFESMKNLQVLDITGLSFTSLPSSIEFLENLKSLNLDNCHLEDVTVLGKLKKLQCLSFHNSSITRLPKEIGALTELRILTLADCTGLKVIEPGVLGSLVKLEILEIANGFDQWEDENEAPRRNASLAELNNMKDLSILWISIPHFSNLLGDLPFGKLKEYAIQIGDVWDWLGDYKQDRVLKLKLDSGNLLDEEWVQRCLRMTQDLYLDGLQDGNDSIHDLCAEGFQELKHLHIQNSISLQCIVHSSEYAQCNAFSRLESLFLNNLKSFKKICHGCLALESFGKLKIVKVDNCGEIKHLFSLSMMRIFLQLEEIEISRCHLMEQIVANVEADEDGDELPISKEIWNSQFPSDNLEAITIKRCQLIREVFDLEGLIANGDVEILSRLTKLTLSDLQSLRCICSKNPRRLLCFRNLRALKVQNCENLKFLFSYSMAKALVQIKEIEIASCKLMEAIMDVQEEESEKAATIDTLEFPLLTTLSLEKLPNLWTFSHGKYFTHCPSLIRLRISGCPKMTTFSSFKGKQRSMTAYTGLQQVPDCINSGLSSPVLFNQYVHFPSLEELTLLSLCGLRRIWQNELPEESFCKLASITVKDCENLSHIFSSTLIARFQSLKMIEVVQCTSLEALMEHIAVNSKERQKGLVLSDLKEVELWHLPRLNAILTSSTKAMFYFPSLTNVSLRFCHNLRYLFTNDTLRTLHELEMLDISDCNNMQEVVAMGEGEERKLKAVKFSRLRTLKLCSLKSLISFSSGSCAFEFPSLRNLSILECTELKAFILRVSAPRVEMTNEGAANFDEGPYSLFDKKVIFPKLEELRLTRIQSREFWKNELDYEYICCVKVLEVKQCHNLLNVVPSFMWKRLLHYVESLTVESCNLIEGICTIEGLNVMEREATRSSPLRELSLCDLPNLTYVWKNEDLPNLCLRNLTSVRIGKCPRLRNLFTISMVKSLGQLQYLGLSGCGEMEYIVVKEEKPEEAADVIVIPQLVTLYLHSMPKLKSFGQGKHIYEWPSLKVFTVKSCKAVEVVVRDTSRGKLEDNVPTKQALLLVNKVCTPFSLMTYLISRPYLLELDYVRLCGLTSAKFSSSFLNL
ncbi:hypothetical protein BT93_D1334 [Corymbia citriodora subsp. variegata]|nr:hypothetical protein BT93_D1334 [Corymbia citriodora subsp. variegata]